MVTERIISPFEQSRRIPHILVVPMSVNLLDLRAIITGIKNGERNINGASMICAKSAHIQTDESVKWTLDGEYGGEYYSVDFDVNHNAVEFVCKSNNSGGNFE